MYLAKVFHIVSWYFFTNGRFNRVAADGLAHALMGIAVSLSVSLSHTHTHTHTDSLSLMLSLKSVGALSL